MKPGLWNALQSKWVLPFNNVPLPALSLAVVGAQYPNKKKSPARRFEIEICRPGEPIELRPEPKNPADPRAVAVYSCRGIQLGYLTAERAPWIGKLIGEGREVRAIYQRKTQSGAIIRAAFDGEEPVLPPAPKSESAGTEEHQEFWPDYIPPDE